MSDKQWPITDEDIAQALQTFTEDMHEFGTADPNVLARMLGQVQVERLSLCQQRDELLVVLEKIVA